MSKFVVLGGAGAMGQIIVRDLAEFSSSLNESGKAGDAEVVIADYNEENAKKLKEKIGKPNLTAVFADLKDRAALVKLLTGATAVINSTPYYFNIDVMEAALEADCHYLDLGGLFHVTKKQLELDQRFKEKGLLAVLGMGAAPGMTNVMAAEGAEQLDTVDSIDIAVGCVDFFTIDHPLPVPYALDTILDEYTRPPMVFENGDYRAAQPMSGLLKIDFPEPVGECEAILTLHSEVLTLPVTYAGKGIKQVTFRLGLPQDLHERFKLLAEIGLGGAEKIEVDGQEIVPRRVLAKLLERFPVPDYVADDCEVIRVDVRGQRNGEATLVRLESIIYADKKWNVSCGGLDTGVPPSIVAQMIAAGAITERGVLAPECCVPRRPFFDELARRNMVIEQQTVRAEELRRAPA